jgi:hypothetical protein
VPYILFDSQIEKTIKNLTLTVKNKNSLFITSHIVAYLLNARTVELEKQPLLGNAGPNNPGIVTKRHVTRTAVAMKRMDKHVSAEKNSRNNRTVFSVRSVPRCYKKGKADHLSQLIYETPACQDMSLGAELSGELKESL